MSDRGTILRPPTAQENERQAAKMDAAARGYEARGHAREAANCRLWAAAHRRSAAVQRAKHDPSGQGVLDFGGVA